MVDRSKTLTSAARQTALAVLSTKLRAARLQSGFTQAEVAHNLGVSTQSVRNWEAGRTEPSAERVQRMSTLYDVPAEEFQNATLEPKIGALSPESFNRVKVNPSKLRLARVQAKLTRAEAGEATGISERSLARYERGEAKPKLDRLMALAYAYEKPTTWFVANPEGEGVEHDEVRASICEKYSTPIDDATIAYATAHPQLSGQAVNTISEFIVFVHQREIRRNAPAIRVIGKRASTK